MRGLPLPEYVLEVTTVILNSLLHACCLVAIYSFQAFSNNFMYMLHCCNQIDCNLCFLSFTH